MKRKISPSEEDYLKAIYHKTTADAPVVSTTLLAEEMGAKPSSVTDMVQRLSEKSLVIYQKYKGVKLSDTGNTKALSIIRKHRLWEVFLVNKLHFSWDQVHDIAEQLEHIIVSQAKGSTLLTAKSSDARTSMPRHRMSSE